MPSLLSTTQSGESVAVMMGFGKPWSYLVAHFLSDLPVDATNFIPCFVIVFALLGVRCIEAGLSAWVSAALAPAALCVLLNRRRMDDLFWRYCIGESSDDLREVRAIRQADRNSRARSSMIALLCCGVLYHASRGDDADTPTPGILALALFLLKPSQSKFVAYFINGFSFEYLCYARGGTHDEAMLWSPVLLLPFFNLMVIDSVSVHAALEMWRVAAVLKFCVITELRVVITSLCLLMTACRVVEGQYDLSLVIARRAERMINEAINVDRKQLIGVLSHELRNRLDILTNLIAEGFAGEGASCNASSDKEQSSDSSTLLQQSALMQQTVSVVLDLLDIERKPQAQLLDAPKTCDEEEKIRPVSSSSTATNLRLLVHSAQKLQIITHGDPATVKAQASMNTAAAMNTVAPFEVRMDDLLIAQENVMIDKKRTHWILCHLLANAFVGCGMGPDASVLVTCSIHAATVVFEIKNTGDTHSQEVLDQALKFHQQALNSHIRRWGGHGLGLRHVAAMLQLMQCPPLELTAYDNTVTARFVIPCAVCSDPVAVTDSIQTASLQNFNVLVVDDEPIIRKISTRILEKHGCSVVTAENGALGVAAFQEQHDHPPMCDVVLMDMQMPVLMGDAAVQQIRALELQHGWPRTSIFARTGNTNSSDLVHYQKCRMDGCIPKAGNIGKQLSEALAKQKKQPGEFINIS